MHPELAAPIPTAYAARQLRPSPPPEVLPALLTNILFYRHPEPVALTPLKPTRARVPTRTRAHTPAGTRARLPTPGSARAHTPARTRARASQEPSNANIGHVKSIFNQLYPGEGDAQYNRFRTRLDALAEVHLDNSRALSHQDEESLTIVNEQLVNAFPSLDRCVKTWPIAVCLQGKFHNSSARNKTKVRRKVVLGLKSIK
ncbi:hypothetical protein DFH06DRAFT_1127504 [Mycena polygramma]|nr:hypothetical protein DFH06DRAFT_1127504 [Mycena polygramma]